MPNVTYFFLATAALIVGYIVYGAFLARVFGEDANRPTPARTMADGVDYIEMPTWKVWFVHLLNIAGTGPVFGPILGALYGPSALLWIVVGAIFAGGVHDYMSGMLSLRYGGCNVPEVTGRTLGRAGRQFMRVFSVVLLVLVGTVFVIAPASLLARLFSSGWGGEWSTPGIWVGLIFVYYFLATIMPIDKIIGRIYPIFGVLLMIMALGVTLGMFTSGTEFYNSVNWREWGSSHPRGLPLFPLIFITIACGALSGFHSTQSPIMSRCLGNERAGRYVFYGSMIAEGFIALVWGTVGMSFYHGPEALDAALAAGGPGNVVMESSMALMGTFGGGLAVLGVIVLPVTSGDTAFRAARLTLAEWLHIPQRGIGKRLALAAPIFIVGIFLSRMDFDVIWRYFGWANQSLATVMLFAGATWLAQRGRFHWICSVPAVFMTAVCVSYICNEPGMGFGLDIALSNGIGAVCATFLFALFMLRGRRPADGDGSEARPGGVRD